MAIPMRLTCQVCEVNDTDWHTCYSDLASIMAQYLLHMIVAHWDILQECHDNPLLIEAAKNLVL